MKIVLCCSLWTDSLQCTST